MCADGIEPTFRVVGMFKNGERVVISNHTTREAADRVIGLLAGGEFVDIHIEEIHPKKPKKPA